MPIANWTAGHSNAEFRHKGEPSGELQVDSPTLRQGAAHCRKAVDSFGYREHGSWLIVVGLFEAKRSRANMGAWSNDGHLAVPPVAGWAGPVRKPPHRA